MTKTHRKFKVLLLSLSIITTIPLVVACNTAPTAISEPEKPTPPVIDKPDLTPGMPPDNGATVTNPPNSETNNIGADAQDYVKYTYVPNTNANGIAKTVVSNARLITNSKALAVPGQASVNTYNSGISNVIPNNNNWDPSKSEAANEHNFFQATQTSPQTHFGTDLLNRQVLEENGQKYYLIADQKIPANTPFVKYAHSNQAIKLNANGWAEFTSSEYDKVDLTKTFFPKMSHKHNMDQTIPTEQHHRIYRSSVAIVTNTFTAPGKTATPGAATGQKGGTGWILDYKLPNDNSYPLVWYFATNAHVARNLYNSQSYGNYGTRAASQNVTTTETKIISFHENLNDDNFITPNSTSNTEKVVVATIRNPHAKVLYIGDDFLKTKPHDFFPKQYAADLEEIADFGVIEITFNNEEEAKKATHQYANWSANKKWKFRQTSYLANPSKNGDPEFYVGGFPAESKATAGTQNPTIRNNKRDLENQLNPDLNDAALTRITPAIQAQGSPLSNSRYHSSIEGYNGIIDPTIGVANLLFEVYGQKYGLAGLNYAIRSTNMGEGSSGSMVVNRNNQIVGIHYAEWGNSDVGVAMALISERYIFSNLQEKYLPAYDLINGGGADQKSSYKDALKSAQKLDLNFKTFLFPQGLKN